MNESLIYLDTPTLLLLSAVIFLILLIIRLEIKMRRLLKGKNGRSLESSIITLINGQRDMSKFRRDTEKYLEKMENRVNTSVRAVETVRFNPFKGNGEGGNQSFATTFIDEKGDGVILSSIFARDRMSIFAKPVVKFNSTYDLTAEEKHAIAKAKEKI